MPSVNGQGTAPKLVALDPEKIKIRELREVEEKVGRLVGMELATGQIGVDTLQGLVWLSMRRANPEATFEDAGELSFGDMMAAMEGLNEPDPPQAASPAEPSGKPPKKRSPRSAGSTG